MPVWCGSSGSSSCGCRPTVCNQGHQGYCPARMGSRLLSAVALLAVIAGLAACGDDGGSGGTAKLNLWVFNEPSGAFTNAAKRCSKASNGAYTISFNALS